MTEVSRNLLRSLTYFKRNELDTLNVCASIDNGLWSPDYLKEFIHGGGKYANKRCIKNLSDQEITCMHTRYPRPDISIKIFEDNFSAFLDLKQIKDYIPLTQYDKYKEAIHELCVTTSSIYLILDRLQNA